MIRISKKTKKSRPILRKEIVKYFGENGLGLTSKDPFNFFAYFEGGDGYVAVDILDEEDFRIIDVQAMAWEHHVKQFLDKF